MLNDSFKNSFTLSSDSESVDRNFVDTLLKHQVDLVSAQNISSRKYLIVAHQTAIRIGAPDKAYKIAVFDNLIVRKYHVDIDGVRYPRDGVSIDDASTDYVDQYRGLKLFFREYLGEELADLLISYTDKKTKHPIQVIDHFNPKKIPLILELEMLLMLLDCS